MDLHPANVLLAPAGPVVIDWTNARAGPPELDLAMSWLASRPLVASVIAGATKPEQVEANVRAATALVLTQDDLAEIDRLTV